MADPVDEAISDVLVTMHGISGVDYCKLNAITKMDVYPLPMIDDSLDLLSGQQFFTTLDLASGYWQVQMAEDARERREHLQCTQDCMSFR